MPARAKITNTDRSLAMIFLARAMISVAIAVTGIANAAPSEDEAECAMSAEMPERALEHCDRAMESGEFGGRNTTEPMERHVVAPYVAGHTVDLFFPTAEIPVLAGERTFWEKATLIHVDNKRFARRECSSSSHATFGITYV